MSALDPELRKLAVHLAEIHKRAKAFGIFTDDRELLGCPGCGLKEDVATNGILFTCRDSDLNHDTGLRFKRVNKYAFRCPDCGQIVKQ